MRLAISKLHYLTTLYPIYAEVQISVPQPTQIATQYLHILILVVILAFRVTVRSNYQPCPDNTVYVLAIIDI